MPIYDFKCSECDHRFQRVRKITAEDSPACPNCGSSQTEKLISPSAFVLKGSGWYLTDYSNKNKPAPSQTDSGSGGSSDD